MRQFGISGNLISLGAVGCSLISVGAEVAENIVRQLGGRQHQLGRVLKDGERTQTVLAASKQVGEPMFFGVVIITVVYIPILALTAVGFIALTGVAVPNGVVSVSDFNQLHEEGKALLAAVIEGPLTRLGPVLMTAVGADVRAVARGRCHRRHPGSHVSDAGSVADLVHSSRTKDPAIRIQRRTG